VKEHLCGECQRLKVDHRQMCADHFNGSLKIVKMNKENEKLNYMLPAQ
jgi:hypothetical protein